MNLYSKTIQEEELKNKVRADWFSGYDNTEIPGKVDFMLAKENRRIYGLKLSVVSKKTSMSSSSN